MHQRLVEYEWMREEKTEWMTFNVKMCSTAQQGCFLSSINFTMEKQRDIVCRTAVLSTADITEKLKLFQAKPSNRATGLLSDDLFSGYFCLQNHIKTVHVIQDSSS